MPSRLPMPRRFRHECSPKAVGDPGEGGACGRRQPLGVLALGCAALRTRRLEPHRRTGGARPARCLVAAWACAGPCSDRCVTARTPLKLVLVDRFRQRWLPRTLMAAKVAVVELAVIAALVVYAVSAGDPFWAPLLVAAPLVAIDLWFDMRSRSRRLIPELAGSIGIGSIAAAIALTGGSSASVAWGLWIVIGARSVAAIPYVRGQILRTKARPAPSWHSDSAQLAAGAVAALGWAVGMVPVAANHRDLGSRPRASRHGQTRPETCGGHWRAADVLRTRGDRHHRHRPHMNRTTTQQSRRQQ